MTGIVVVSHSRALAEAAVALAREMAHASVRTPGRIEIAAGLDPGAFGTDANAIARAITAADDGAGVVVLSDVGSALLSTDLALEMLADDVRRRVRVSAAPLIEGLLVAAVAAAGGAAPDEVAAEAGNALAGKQAQLGETVPEPPPTPATTRDPEASSAAAEPEAIGRFTVANRHGLHARPAARLVREARRFDATVRVRNLTTGSRDVPAASLSRLATLGALRGHDIEVRASGPAAREAIEHVLALARRSFDEPEDAGPSPAPSRALGAGPSPPAPGSGTRLVGVPAGPGIGIGPAWFAATRRIEVPDEPGDDPATEWHRLRDAITVVERDVQRLRDETTRQVGHAEAAIFDAHLMLLDDPELLAAARARIERGQTAPAAWAAVLGDTEAGFAAMTDPYLRARAADVRAVADRVLRTLLGEPARPLAAQGVLIARDLTPAEAADLEPASVSAVLLAGGSPTSHAAILARARGLPTVVGLGFAVLQIPAGTRVGVDGGTGEILVDPDSDRLAELTRRAHAAAAARSAAIASSGPPASTRDGLRIAVGANLGSVAEAHDAVRSGADLAGLVRTELLFADRAEAPAVDEQAAVYLAVAEAMDGRRLTLRTLDVGGDKPLPYLPTAAETNPFLGVRGLRLSLVRPDLLRDQLRAIVRTARQAPVSLMFPMVSTLRELLDARRLLDEVISTEGGAVPGGFEVGIMVEVPAVALKTAAFAPRVDFFSIGTNDLTQYALAAERGNPALAPVGDAFDPGVLALIHAACRGAAGGPRVAVCGELAGDPRAAGLLIGLGVRELSVNPSAIPEVKQAVRSVESAAATSLAAAAVAMGGAADVRRLIGAS